MSQVIWIADRKSQLGWIKWQCRLGFDAESDMIATSSLNGWVASPLTEGHFLLNSVRLLYAAGDKAAKNVSDGL